jgi:hypothetical protein
MLLSDVLQVFVSGISGLLGQPRQVLQPPYLRRSASASA